MSPPDLSLPDKAPADIGDEDLLPAAIYTLVPMTDTELKELQEECEREPIECDNEPGNSARPAPQPRFVNKPLRDVFNYHVELGKQGVYCPRYFIAVIEKDWQSRGVLLVTLADDEDKVDSYRTKAEDAAMSVLNLDIANTDWEENKENYEFDPDASDNDEDDDDGDSDDE